MVSTFTKEGVATNKKQTNTVLRVSSDGQTNEKKKGLGFHCYFRGSCSLPGGLSPRRIFSFFQENHQCQSIISFCPLLQRCSVSLFATHRTLSSMVEFGTITMTMTMNMNLYMNNHVVREYSIQVHNTKWVDEAEANVSLFFCHNLPKWHG